MLAFFALADPTRLRIVEMLASSGQLSASNISSKFAMSPPAISQHLKILREAGLVRVAAIAQQRIYTIDPAGISEMEDWLQHTRAVWQRRLDALDALLQEEVIKSKKPRRRPKNDRK